MAPSERISRHLFYDPDESDGPPDIDDDFNVTITRPYEPRKSEQYEVG